MTEVARSLDDVEIAPVRVPWDRLRRIGKDASFEKATVGVMALLATLVTIKSQPTAASWAFAKGVSESILAIDLLSFFVYLLSWYIFQMVLTIFMPSMFLDFSTVEAYTDAQMKGMAVDDVAEGGFRILYRLAWRNESAKGLAIRAFAACVLGICLLAFAVSVVLLASIVYKFALILLL